MFKALSKDITVYGVSEFVIYLIPLITVPIYTRIFNPAEYGILSLITSVVSMLAIFLNLGMDNAIARYFFEAKDKRERTALISTGFWFVVIWSSMLIIGLSFFSKQFSSISFKVPKYALFYQLAWIAAPLGMIIAFSKNVVRYYFAPWKFTIISLCDGILVFFFALLFILGFKFGLIGIFLGKIVGSFFAMFPGVFFVRKDLKPIFSLELIKKLLRYGLPFVPAGIAYWIFNLSDRFLIARLSTLEQLGLYSVAVKVTLGVKFLERIFARAWSPHAYKLYKSNPRHREIFGQMLLYILAAFSFVAISLTLFGPEILRIFTTEKYYAAVYAIGPLALSLVAGGLNQITMLGINLAEKTKYISYCAWLAALLNVGLNFLLIPKYGMMGAAIATMISYFVLTFAYTLISQRLYPIRLDIKKIFIVALAVAIFMIFSLVINSPCYRGSVSLLIFLKISSLVLFPVCLFITRVFGKKEIAYLQKAYQLIERRKPGR